MRGKGRGVGAEEINWGKKKVGERKDWEKRGEIDTHDMYTFSLFSQLSFQ